MIKALVDINRALLAGAFLTVFLSASFYTQAQREKPARIKIINANTMLFDEDFGENVRKLIGEVQFKHKGSVMYCDSAFFFGSTNSLKAYGNVRIEKGDSMVVTGDSLYYRGNTEFAELRGNATLDDGTQLLETDYLDYDLANNFAYYTGGGVLTNKKEGSILVSEIGYFYDTLDLFHFKNNVKMTSPDYDIRADTMHYDQKNDVVYFFGPTHIIFDSSRIYCEKGYYNRRDKSSEFVYNAKIEEDERIIEGDSIVYDQKLGIGEVFCNSVITDTVNKVIIYSDYAFLNEKDSFSIATGHLLMKQNFEDDTLYLHSDTLVTEYDSSRTNRVVRGFNRVKFFKTDMQGKCDSLVYHTGDSLIYMYADPVLWSDSNQITGDIIKIKTYDGKIDKLFINNKSFIASEVDFEKRRYNQIKGRELVAFFRKNEIYKIDIEGNGQTIYYTQEDDGSTSGMNRLDCSNMTIFIEDSQIDNIRFYVKPDAIMYPLKDLTEEIKFYKDFKWREGERPVSKDHIYFWEPITEGKGIKPLPVKTEELPEGVKLGKKRPEGVEPVKERRKDTPEQLPAKDSEGE